MKQDQDWLSDTYVPDLSTRESLQALTKRQGHALHPSERAARARLMAIFCHMSVLFGLPVFLIPMFSRDEPFVLHHAKAAGAIFLLFYGSLLASILLNPWLLLLTVGTYFPGLMAVYSAAGGKRAGLLALGPIGEGFFFLLKAKTKPRQLESSSSPPMIEV